MIFNKIKNYLGVEGLKANLLVEESYQLKQKSINAVLELSTIRPQQIKSIQMELIEKYQRGKKAEQIIDEYTIGKIDLNISFELEANGAINIPFELPFHRTSSLIEEESDNFLKKSKLKILKNWFKIKSDYYMKCKILVEGTVYQSVVLKEINLK